MAFSGTLTASYLNSIGNITKGADADASVVIEHGLSFEPEYVHVCAKSGSEAAWRISAKDATHLTLVASAGAGTGGSICSVLAGKRHSIIG